MHPDPSAPWQPPLRWPSHLWRLAVALLISAAVWSELAERQWTQQRWLFWLDIGLGLVAFGLVLLRRRYPLTIALLLAVAGAVSGLAGGPAVLAAVSLATRRDLPQVLLVGVVNLVCAQTFAVVQPPTGQTPYWVVLAINITGVAATLAVGMYVGSRRELLWTLQERAHRAETEQALRVDQARATERERIAREMHDVLGHRISLVTMHAGALAYRTDLSPDEVADSAQVIQSNAHQAMEELRTVLGVLRGSGDREGDRPQPTLADVATLVDEARDSGMRVDLDCRVDGHHRLPERTGRTVYRIVQEGLTNVRKHAPAARASVAVEGGPGRGIDVRLENSLPPGPPAPSPHGYGLVGLTERAELAGGRLRAHTHDRRFVLEVWLPWPA